MKHLIAARSDKDKPLSFPHQGQEHLFKKTGFIFGGFIRARVNSVIGKINHSKCQSSNNNRELLQIQVEKQVEEASYKGNSFPASPLSSPAQPILFYFHMESVKIKPKQNKKRKHNGSQSSIVTF